VVRFSILGSLEVDGLPITSAQEARLLAVLLLRRNQLVPLTQVEDAVWGDDVPPARRSSLQSKVSRLRQRVGSDRIVGSRAGYRLDVGPGECDADDLERLSRRLSESETDDRGTLALLDEALGLFRGPPLGDLSVEPFAGGAAVRFEQRRVSLGLERVDTLLRLHRGDLAVESILPLRTDEPYDERACELHMRALVAVGRSVDAVRVYQEFRLQLLDGVGMEPSSDLAALELSIVQGAGPNRTERTVDHRQVARITRTSTPWNQPLHTRPRFVGREDTIALLRRELRPHAGVRLVVVNGDGGIGKTRIALETASLAQRLGRDVKFVRCRETQSTARSFNVPAPAVDWTRSDARSLVVESLADDLYRELPKGVLIVEDLHWADEATLEVIGSYALRASFDDAPILLVVTTRPELTESRSAWLDRFRRDVPSTLVSLGPFGEPEIFELIREATSWLPTSALSNLVHFRGGGNPLLALTSLEVLRGSGHLTATGPAVSISENVNRTFSVVPGDLRVVLDDVLATFDVELTRVLVEAAYSGAEALLARLPSTRHLDAERVAALLRPAEEAGVIAVGRGLIRFRHDLYRRILLDRVHDVDRQSMHAALFRSADSGDSDRDVRDRAEHAFLAGDELPPFERLDALRIAAERALSETDWSNAARWLRSALAIADSIDIDDSAGLAIRALTGAALFRDHDAADAIKTLAEAIESARALEQPDVWGRCLLDHMRASAFLTGTVPAPQRREIDEFVSAAIEIDPSTCARVLSLGSEHAFSFGDADLADAYLRRARNLVDESSPLLLRAELAFAEGLTLLGRFDLIAADRAFRESSELGRQAGSAWVTSWGLGRRVFILLLQGRFAAATEIAVAARTAQLSAGVWSELSFTATLEAYLADERGDDDLYAARVAEAERLSHRTGFAFTPQFLFPLELMRAVHDDDRTGVEATLTRWHTHVARIPLVFERLAAASGDATVGLGERQLRPLDPERIGPGQLTLLAAQIELACINGDSDLARTSLEAVQRLDGLGLRCIPASRAELDRVSERLLVVGASANATG
jgi:DNA-binding SARP family transcriptional activator